MISYSTSPLKIYTPPNTTQPPTCRATLLYLSLPVFVSLSLSPCLLSVFLSLSQFPLRLAQDRLINQAVCRDFSSDARLLPNLVDDGFDALCAFARDTAIGLRSGRTGSLRFSL